MQGINDQQYLKSDQYASAGNLSARIQLHVRFSTNRYGWLRWVFDHFAFAPECTILELGCGPGSLWRENRDRIPSGWNITLSDFSPGMLAEARQTTAEIAHPFKFEVIDAQAIPFPDHAFEGVIANHMLYHVPDLPTVLQEIVRVLKPAGRFYATTIGSGHLQELLELVARFIPAWVSPPKSFLLDNGEALLAPYFTNITLERYEDRLIVTDPRLLFEYICSLGNVKAVPPQTLAALQTFLQEEISRTGALTITKDSGTIAASVRK